MGIKNLHKFLKKNCPEVYKTRSISEYAFKIIPIDISLYLFKYKTIYGEHWIDPFIKLVSCLRKNDIHSVFIYDNGAPEEKNKERERRKASRQQLQTRIDELDKDIEQYYHTKTISDKMREIYNKRQSKVVRLLASKNSEIFDISIVEEEYHRISKQVPDISESDFELTKTLFTILGVPYIVADGEAEAYCSLLCWNDLSYGVLSEDTDVLAYGTKKFLTKLNTTSETVVELRIDNIISSLDITYEQFRDLCIMCGTDYNTNIPRIGPEKGYRLLKKHSSIEGIQRETDIDISCLNHIRGRELFTHTKKITIPIPYCKEAEWNKLSHFLFKNNCKMNINYVKSCFRSKEIVFEDEEVE